MEISISEILENINISEINAKETGEAAPMDRIVENIREIEESIPQDKIKQTAREFYSLGLHKRYFEETKTKTIANNIVCLYLQNQEQIHSNKHVGGFLIQNDQEIKSVYIYTEDRESEALELLEQRKDQCYEIEIHKTEANLKNKKQRVEIGVIMVTKNESTFLGEKTPGINMKQTGETRSLQLRLRDTESSTKVFEGHFSIFKRHGVVYSDTKGQFYKGEMDLEYILYRSDYKEIEWSRLLNEISLGQCIKSIVETKEEKGYTAMVFDDETAYALVGSLFVYYFIERNMNYPKEAIGLTQKQKEILQAKIKRKQYREYTQTQIYRKITENRKLVQKLFKHFDIKHNPQHEEPWPQRKERAVCLEREIEQDVKRISSRSRRVMFKTLIKMNNHTQRTNFYRIEKKAVSIMLRGDILSPTDYPKKPYGIIFVVGQGFHGFHVRMEEIARGGLRMVATNNIEEYEKNKKHLFQECYGLAHTQNKKNKDIPEGGSKGVFLVYPNQAHPQKQFEGYIDAVLDLLVQTKRKTDKSTEKEVMLFIGPDEGTADFMDQGGIMARDRGYGPWRSFTTGKTPSMGGIPHITHGMTTRSVQEYKRGVLNKEGVSENTATKIQTGGPDGDLGSNEIKSSKDNTTGVVDVSGVAYDPDGLDKEELQRLAKGLKTISEFRKEKLGKGGFVVLADKKQINIPQMKLNVENGIELRNKFHLLPFIQADLFVPCGGRPCSVDIGNVGQMLTEEGKPRFKYIIEGANMFFTQDARIVLERAGTIIFKDSSVNKGGVISSSYEMLIALALPEDEFERNMEVKNGRTPQFYKEYVEEVKSIITQKSQKEFEHIWKHCREHGKSICEYSDTISESIVLLKKEIGEEIGQLWATEQIRQKIILEIFPQILRRHFGDEKLKEIIIPRLPENYIRNMVAGSIASEFVYSNGTANSPVAFYKFMKSYIEGIEKKMK